MDIVPTPSASAPRTPRPAKPRGRVLTLSWKLPARLRRPIRAELKRERQRQLAALNFKKKRLYASSPTPEQNTGDVHLKSQPEFPVIVPPYQGNFLKRQAKPAVLARGSKTLDLSLKSKPKTQPSIASKPASQKPSASSSRPARDLPFMWTPSAADSSASGDAAAKIIEPKRRFALPIHLSFLPLGLKPNKTAEFVPLSEATRKKKL